MSNFNVDKLKMLMGFQLSTSIDDFISITQKECIEGLYLCTQCTFMGQNKYI